MAKDFSQIKDNLGKMLEYTLDSTLKEAVADSTWQLKQQNAVSDFEKTHCIVLTISSFRFRVMVILHFNFDNRIKQFLADLLGAKLQEVDEEKLIDRLLELSNSFCGHIKRHLQNTSPPLGMSTPNLLASACLNFEGIIELAHEAHVIASESTGGDPLFGASALVSLLDDADFEIDQPPAITQGGGELESFGELELF